MNLAQAQAIANAISNRERAPSPQTEKELADAIRNAKIPVELEPKITTRRP